MSRPFYSDAKTAKNVSYVFFFFLLGALQAVTDAVKVVMSKKWHEIDTLLLHTTNRKYHMFLFGYDN